MEPRSRSTRATSRMSSRKSTPSSSPSSSTARFRRVSSDRSATTRTPTLSCRFAPPPRGTRTPADRRALRIEPPLLERLLLTDLRGYRSLELELGPGPHLVHGPNAAGKTSLLEAVFLLASGHSHRTPTDAEMIRWGADLARVEGVIDGGSAGGGSTLGVALLRGGGAGQR